MKNWRRWLLFLGVAVVMGALALHETGFLTEQVESGSPTDRVAVTRDTVPRATFEVVRRTVSERRRAVGSVVPRSPVFVSARVMAAVLQVVPAVGQPVQEGELIAVLDDRDLAAHVAAVEAGQLATAARAMAAAAETARARAEKARAAAERERQQRLLDRGAGTERELEVAVAADESASAGLEASLAGEGVAASAVTVAERELDAARVAASHARITAPLSGVVSRRLMEPGEIVLPGGPILELYDPRDLRLEAAVPEADVARLFPGSKVMVSIPSSSLEFEAVIDEIVPAADRDTRSVLVKVPLPSTATLRRGVQGTLVYGAGERDAVVVPAAAVRRRGQVESVRVLGPGGAVARRHVRTGEAVDDVHVEVLTGLAPGELVLLGEEGAE